MARLLRPARKTDSVRYETDDKLDFIVLRDELTRGEVNKLMKARPEGEGDLDGGIEFLIRFFELTVVDWSMEDEEENPLKPTRNNYLDLPPEAAGWIDQQLNTQLRKVFGQTVEELEGESSELLES